MRLLPAWAGVALAPLAAMPPPALAQQGSVVEGVVYVRNAKSTGALVYVIPAFAEPPVAPVETVLIDQRNLHFVPRTLAVLPDQAVAFRNSDPILHNVFSPDTLGEDFDLGTYPEGEWRTRRFRRLGAHVILCHIHPEMEAYVVVLPTRHYVLAAGEGRFRIAELPPGTYSLHVWHPRAEPFRREITVRAGDTLRLEIQLERRGATRTLPK
ncbi:MAG: carboxypeptidase regulatory-like domain-containing protein [Gemmatimonadetes bacterium]|nr:carboxypeptidase regulatory-like domain-containing protein [Gemmatimonadota bacterium]